MAANASKVRKRQQRQATLRLTIMVAILICVNMLAARFHTILDLTQEKRFTLSSATKKMLGNMKDVAVIDVYLKGKFPAGFQRLQESVRDRLESFKQYSGAHVVYRFINLTEGKSEKEKNAIYEDLMKKGITPVDLHVQSTDDDYSERIIIPYALVHFNGREKPVALLENPSEMSPMEALNYSETLLEYKFASAIHQLDIPDKPTIAYIVGHNEPLGPNTFDALTTLAQYYHLDTLDITRTPGISKAYDAIIINKPIVPIDDKYKFLIDQYVMNGGHVLWMIDQLNTPIDSLQKSPQFITTDYGLNLDDILFKYGVRVNTDLIEDLQAAPVQTAAPGMQPDYRPWIYFPIFNPTSKHPIVKNMMPVLGKFVNSIDTVADPAIKKTILLQSSKYSRTAASPARVSLSVLKYPLPQEMFNRPDRPVAVLLEGKFHSIFTNRLAPGFLSVWKNELHQQFKTVTDTPTSMIVVSDGDIIGNDYDLEKGPMKMGYWKYSREVFANKDFMLNCMEYLTDRTGLIEARSKDVTLRLLDSGRIKTEKIKWQIVNIGLPIALVFIFATGYTFFRKRKYVKKSNTNN